MYVEEGSHGAVQLCGAESIFISNHSIKRAIP